MRKPKASILLLPDQITPWMQAWRDINNISHDYVASYLLMMTSPVSANMFIQTRAQVAQMQYLIRSYNES